MKRQASPSDTAPVTRGSLPSRAGPSVSDPLSQKALQGKWNPLTVTTPSVSVSRLDLLFVPAVPQLA